MSKDYTPELQQLMLEMMLEDPTSYVRVQDIYNPINFHVSLQEAATFIAEHAEKHKALPAREQIKAVTGVKLEPQEGLNEEHFDWLLEEFEAFTKRKEIERAIYKAADLLEENDFDPVEQMIKDAVQISLTKHMGTDYFDNPRARLMTIKDANGQTSTGWESLDRRLFGGFNKGELNIFAGGSGSGKSLFMQNIALNWVEAGMNGVYITLELSEELCSMRIDSMAADIASKDIFKRLDDVEIRLKNKQRKTGGGLRIKYMPAQSNVNGIRAYLKELQIKTGKKVDFLMVDYLDLLMPVSAKVSPSDLFIKDKYVSEELRNLAKELDILFITASQLNRSAVEEIEFDHSHISGGISKVNTADNLIGIFTSRSMREKGRYQIQLMKTRSSNGVGMKVDLEFDVNTLRITDPGEEAQDGGDFSAKEILSNKKPVPTENEPATPVHITADTKSAKLKSMLAGLRSG